MSDTIGDWLSRVTIPDLYPRKEDPFRPHSASIPATAPAASFLSQEEIAAAAGGLDIYQDWITHPAQRPIVYQRAINFQISVGTSAVPLMNQRFQCDTMLLSILSTVANSVFVGYGSGVTIASGLEIQPGVPVSIAPENSREQWELQRMLETMAAILAFERGYPSPGPMRAPRVVFNANEYYVVASVAAVPLRVMLFNVPELQ